jgi:hypothetical protein
MRTTCVARAQREDQDRWARAVLSIEDPFTGGQFLRYPEQFLCRIEGVDELASTYGVENWQTAIMSGAFHAFRRLKQPRRWILVSELEGKLGSEDMPALAMAATGAVTKLLGADVSELKMSGWRFSHDVVASDSRGDGSQATAAEKETASEKEKEKEKVPGA